MSLNFVISELIDGKSVFKFDRTEMDKGAENWKNVFIVYVVGDLLLYSYMDIYVMKNWN